MQTLDYSTLVATFECLQLQNVPVIAHASLYAFGRVEGGAETLLQTVLQNVGALMMPTHTYTTMITPPSGPPQNGIIYNSEQDLNRMAEFFSPSMPADRMMGRVPELLRLRPDAKRSMHPILSFAGIRANKTIASQTLEEPFAPIRKFAEAGGWVLLLGVDHTSNTTIHYAEKLAGRPQFIRWALTENGIISCPGFPGDSGGFQLLEKELAPHTRKIYVGNALVQAVPMNALIDVVLERLKNNPKDLLCTDMTCPRCNEIRKL